MHLNIKRPLPLTPDHYRKEEKKRDKKNCEKIRERLVAAILSSGRYNGPIELMKECEVYVEYIKTGEIPKSVNSRL